MKISLLICSSLLAVPSLVLAQIEISGAISGYLERGDYLAIDDLLVAQNSELVIEAGTTIEFAQGKEFLIQGYINAVGTETDSIRFHSESDWEGIKFTGSGSDYSEMAFCAVSNSVSSGIDVFSCSITIRNSRFNENSDDADGGGLHFWNIGNCLVENSVITDNIARYGGGIYCANSDSLTLISNIITNNSTNNGGGGGLYIKTSDYIVLSTCMIDSNASSDKGGGISITDCNLFHLTDCIIDSNYSASSGAGIYSVNISEYLIENCELNYNYLSWGDGIAVYVDSSQVSVFDSEFQYNVSEVYYSGVFYSINSDVSVENSSFSNNSRIPASSSGVFGYSCSNSTVDISGSYFEENDGHGINSGNSTIEISSSQINNNGNNGARFGSSAAQIIDCRIFNNPDYNIECSYNNTIEIENCELFNSNINVKAWVSDKMSISGSLIKDSQYTGIYVYSVDSCSIADCVIVDNSLNSQNWNDPSALKLGSYIDHFTIANNIFYSNEAYAIAFDWGADPDAIFINNNLFAQNAIGNFCDIEIPGLGSIQSINYNGDSCDEYYNIYINPQFVNFNNGNYNLQANSPCIDAGSLSSGFDPDSSYKDLGMFYYDQTNLNRVSGICTVNGLGFEGIEITLQEAGAGNEEGFTLTDSTGHYIEFIESGIYDIYYEFEGEVHVETSVQINNDMIIDPINITISGQYLVGNITGTISSGSYRVMGNLTVPFGESLTIESGTTLDFDFDTNLNIQGILTCWGSLNDSIIFTGEDWQGIIFDSQMSDTSNLDYCVIENAISSCLEIDSSVIQMKNSRISGGTSFHYGGGINSYNSITILESCLIADNSSQEYGGGVYADNSVISLTDCEVKLNSSEYGCGIYLIDSEGTIIGCNIKENTIEDNNSSRGGGIYGSYSTVEMENSIIEDNSSRFGSGMYLLFGDFLVNNCDFENNGTDEDGYGGGIYLFNNDGLIMNSSFSANYAETGGIIYSDDSDFTVIDSYFTQTESEETDYAIFCDGRTSIFERCTFINNNGRLIYSDRGHNSVFTRINNCLFVNNNFYPLIDLDNSNFTLRNSIIYGSGGQENEYLLHIEQSSQVTLSNNCFFDNSSPILNSQFLPGFFELYYSNMNGDICDYYKNIFIDPEFVAPSTSDFSIISSSPCIDAGYLYSGFDPDSSYKDIGKYYFDQSQLNRVSGISLVNGCPEEDVVITFRESSSSAIIGNALSDSTGNFLEFIEDGTYDLYFIYMGIIEIIEDIMIDSDTILPIVDIAVGIQHLSGSISGTISSGYYVVDTDITVPVDSSLTIEPGTVFDFSDDTEFFINGKITAIGSESDSIRFTGVVWEGLRIYNVDNDSSIFEYCVIENSSSSNIYSYRSSIVVKDSRIAGGYSSWCGGGIYVDESTLTVQSSIFNNNDCDSWGGGIYSDDSNVDIQSCIFENSNAQYGAGIYFSYTDETHPGTVTILDSHFRQNDSYAGSSICSSRDITINNCKFYQNTSEWIGSVLNATGNIQVEMNDCEVSSSQGGAIYINRSEGIFNDCIFSQNETNNEEIIYSSFSTLEFNRNTFKENTTGYSVLIRFSGGDSVYFNECVISDNDVSELIAGGTNCTISMTDCNIINNNSEYRMSHFAWGNGLFLTNTIFANNYCQNNMFEAEEDFLITTSNCLFNNNMTGEVFLPGINPEFGVITQTNNNGTPCDVYNNIFSNPLFVDPENGNYSLLASSPCIDAGSSDSPLDPDSTLADIGAYYYHQGVEYEAEGLCFLENRINHSGTKVLFDMENTLYQDFVFTDSTGYYSIEVPNGEYNVTFTKTGFSETTIQAVQIDSNVTIDDAMLYELALPPVIVNGYCYKSSSLPLENAAITVIDWSGEVTTSEVYSNINGYYEFELIPGVYDIICEAAGYVADTLKQYDIQFSLTFPDFLLELQPESMSFSHPYPNPFNPVTVIDFGLPEPLKIEMILFDILGRKVRTIIDTQMPPGYHSLSIDASDLASGIYFLSIHAVDYHKIFKLAFVK